MRIPLFPGMADRLTPALCAFAVAARPKEALTAEPPPAQEKPPATPRPTLKGYLLGLIIGLVASFVFLYGAMDRAEYGLHNFNYEIRGPISVHPDIAIVAIDDKSLKEIPEIYPWPRSYFAKLVNKLHAVGAKAIVFDIVFSNPDRQDVKNDKLFASIKQDLAAKGLFIVGFSDVLDRSNIKNDKVFATAIKRAGNVVLGRTLSFEKQQSMFGSMELASLVEPLAILREAAPMGRVDTPFDEDGQMRRGELVRDYSGQGHISLEAMALKLYNPERFQELMQKYTVDCYPVITSKCQAQEFYFDYAGPPHTFPTYSFSEVLENLIEPKKLAGKAVFIGASAAILHDNFPAPFLLGRPDQLPGVEMHANQLNTMLTDRFIARANPLVLVVAIIALCMGMQALLLRIQPVRGALACGGTILFYYCATLYAFIAHRIWVDQMVPMLSLGLVYVGTLFTHYRSEERKKKQVQSMFGQYVSPDVVNQIVTSGQMPTTGGEERVVTLMFSDLAGFTSISENLKPPQLVDLINEYLGAMTEEIYTEQGTVDKYEGDAIMVFWGAPTPQEDHAKRACRAGLKMHGRMAELIPAWHEQGLKYEFGMRIGINSGPVVVGNMGSPKHRLNYTAMGDTVNLASRLEPVNKQYGTKTCISEFTYAQVKDDFVVRELDSIRVKGKIKPVIIYELIAEKGQVMDRTLSKFLDTFAQGLSSYKSRQWEKAIQSFEKALLISPRDHASLMYINRCQEFMVNAPPVDWDGVFVMTTK